MTTTTEQQIFAGALDAAAFQDVVNSTESQLIREKRLTAFASYSASEMPTLRDEEWRRTDPELFKFDQFKPLAALQSVGTADSHELDELFDVVVSVNDTGYHINDRTGELAKGSFVVKGLDEAAESHADVLAKYMQDKVILEKDRKFNELNGAFWNFGLFIHIPKDLKVEKGVLVRYNLKQSGSMLIPKLMIVSDAGSNCNVVEVYEAGEDTPVFCVGARELYVGESARLQLFALQEWGRQSFHIGEDQAKVQRDAQLDWVTLTLGSKASKMNMTCDVADANSNAYMSGLFFADKDQHVDQRTLQQHSSPHTYSNLLYKGAVKDQGHSVYQGIIAASEGAIDVDAYQMNNNLVLNTGARADSLPGLKIDADDLKCSHGSTMGNLDEDQIFYLRSRGFTEAAARQALVLAFFEEIIQKIPYEFLQERIRADVNRKLSLHLGRDPPQAGPRTGRACPS